MFEATTDLALFYLDASAIVKLIKEEPESLALRNFLGEDDLVSCELVLTEVPRAIRRAVAIDPTLPFGDLLDQANEVLESIALLPTDRDTLLSAGAIAEPALRALDAIHVAAALSVSPISAFVSYDERQQAAARLAALRTMRP